MYRRQSSWVAWVRHAVLWGLFSCLWLCLAPQLSSASTTFRVDAGWDLFQTVPGATTFDGVPFMGVPLGTFNFGGSIGVQSVGSTDTIIQRLTTATAPVMVAGASATTLLLMDALQLETVAPTTVFGPLDNYFIDLTPSVGSTGAMTITWDGSGLSGTFSSFLDVNFDIHKGSLSGPVVFSESLTVTNSGAPWSDLAPSGALAIPNVNLFLNGGSDPTGDFWPLGAVIEQEPGGVHVVQDTPAPAPVPEPASLGLIGVALAALGANAWRRKTMIARG